MFLSFLIQYLTPSSFLVLTSGQFVRYGPDSISINTSTALKEIYGFGKNVRKSKFYSVFPPNPQAFNTHNSIDKISHGRKRRVLSHAFSDSAMRAMEEHVLNHIQIFCDKLGGSTKHSAAATNGHAEPEWSAAKNMADWCNYLTFDVMGDLAFGKAFDMLEKPDNRFALSLVGNAAQRHLICGTQPLLHTLHLDKFLFHKIAAGRERYMAYSKAQAAERMKLGVDADRRDFFYYLLKAKDQETGKGFGMAELWGESNLLIIAGMSPVFRVVRIQLIRVIIQGSDTTSTALAATIFYLVHNPTTLQTLTTTIRTAFSSLSSICSTNPDLINCAFLRACIDEAMRLSPSVGGALPREVLPGGLTVDGHHFPPGTVLAVPHYAIHHNPFYYPDPFAYKPERWLTDDKEAVGRAQSAFCPFSVGPRGCIGKGMAYMELSLALSRLMWLFDMRLKPGSTLGEGGWEGAEYGRQRVGEYQLMDKFTSWMDGPLVEFRGRLD
ncbi:hypothetical protein GP486_005004 [Trichoglossum hirsutum]|uniref:Cytochrome P450 n=1 Tax=Trichoglossum hirsutum TaxID=265104 RepID=A0A9P8RNJ4_9PEZI|nr:hypothetical protein GP486_005004 [Trichoglossum hirsutum]